MWKVRSGTLLLLFFFTVFLTAIFCYIEQLSIIWMSELGEELILQHPEIGVGNSGDFFPRVRIRRCHRVNTRILHSKAITRPNFSQFKSLKKPYPREISWSTNFEVLKLGNIRPRTFLTVYPTEHFTLSRPTFTKFKAMKSVDRRIWSSSRTS